MIRGLWSIPTLGGVLEREVDEFACGVNGALSLHSFLSPASSALTVL